MVNINKQRFYFQDYKHLKTFLNNMSYCILSDNGKDNIVRKNELYNYIDMNNLIYSQNIGYYNNFKENSYMLLYPNKTDIMNFARDKLNQESIIFKDKNTLKNNSSFDLIYLDKDNGYTTFYDKLIIQKHGFNNLGYGTIVKCLDGNIYDFVFS